MTTFKVALRELELVEITDFSKLTFLFFFFFLHDNTYSHFSKGFQTSKQGISVST